MSVIIVLLLVLGAALFIFVGYDFNTSSQLTLLGSVALTAALAIVLVIAHNVWDYHMQKKSKENTE